MSNSPPDPGAGQALERLAVLVARLRAPDGCPWDREQTPASAAGYLLEEAFEAVEAIETGDPEEIKAELGDLLFQVVFQAQLFSEQGLFDLSQVMEVVHEKMVRRHPHVFGPDHLKDSAQVRARWQEIKSREQEGSGQGLLDSVPKAAPALVRAQRLGQRAAKVDFDWPDAAGVWQKIAEETGELARARDKEEAASELGDVLFAWAQWARHSGLGAEAALREANRRFVHRFKLMEHMAAAEGSSLDQMEPSRLEQLWQRAKKELAG